MRTRAVGPDVELARRLQDEVASALERALGGARTVALVDFPYHRNAGDAAIWAGERAALRRLGVRVAYVADVGRYQPDRLREALPDGPVLLSGGGNVGDLWQWNQALRERVLTDLPERRVVQLGQSVHFTDPANAARFRGIVQAHGGYAFLARDAEAAMSAAELGCASVTLAPDMAFGLGPIARTRTSTHGVVVLARDDHEAASGLRAAASAPVDWHTGRDVVWTALRSIPRAARYATGHPAAWRAADGPTTAALEAMNARTLRRGMDLLSSGETVVTDRLHAHILCTLAGIPHVVLDNTYGKISALHEAWTSDSRLTQWARTPAEAFALASRMADAS